MEEGGETKKTHCALTVLKCQKLFLTFHSYPMKPIYFSCWFISRNDCNKSHHNSSSLVAPMLLNEAVCGVELYKLFFQRLIPRILQITLSAPLPNKNIMLSCTYGLSETFCWCYIGLNILKPKPSYCNTAVFPFLGKLDTFLVIFCLSKTTHTHTHTTAGVLYDGLIYLR